MKLRLLTLFLWAILLAAGAVEAQKPADPLSSTGGAASFVYPVTISARFVPATVVPGEEVRLDVTADIASGYHIYAVNLKGEGPIATSIKLGDNKVLQEIDGKPWTEPKPHEAYDKGFETNLQTQSGKPVFSRLFRVAPDAVGGDHDIQVTFLHQACQDASCLAPKKLSTKVRLVVTGGNPAPSPTTEPTQAPAPTATQAAARGGFVYPVTVSGQFTPSSATAGSEVRLDVSADIATGYHIYAVDLKGEGPVPTSIKLGENKVLQEIDGKPWNEPKPHEAFDKGFETNLQTHSGKPVFSRLFRVAPDASKGEYDIPVTFQHQACRDASCLPPKKLQATIHLVITGTTGGTAPGQAATPAGTAGSAPAPTATPKPAAATINTSTPPAPRQAGSAAQPETLSGFDDASAALASSSTGSLFWFAIGFGLLSLLTPCVFPMIPITVSFFTKRAAKTRGEALKLALIYSGSIVAGFSLFGFGLALALRGIGAGAEKAGLINQIATNPWVNLVLTALFVAFALSLFGLFELQLPSSWANALQQKRGKRTDAIGAFFMAMVFVVVSFTCTGPVVGPLIVLTLQGNWLNPFFGLLGYSIGFAAPFFVLSLVPQGLSSLPKSGGWLNSTKVVMGFIELAAALKFLSNVDLVWQWGAISREVLLAAWVAVAAAITVYLLGFVLLPHDTKVDSVGPVRLLFSLGFGTLALYLAFGLFGGRLASGIESLMPPYSSGTIANHGSPASGELTWIKNDLPAALAQAKAENKPVFVDFTGWTCTNCRLMEISMFPRPEIHSRLEKFVRVRLYTDDEKVGEDMQKIQNERFGTFSLPFYVLLSPQDQQIATFSGMTQDEARFRSFLDRALAG